MSGTPYSAPQCMQWNWSPTGSGMTWHDSHRCIAVIPSVQILVWIKILLIGEEREELVKLLEIFQQMLTMNNAVLQFVFFLNWSLLITSDLYNVHDVLVNYMSNSGFRHTDLLGDSPHQVDRSWLMIWIYRTNSYVRTKSDRYVYFFRLPSDNTFPLATSNSALTLNGNDVDTFMKLPTSKPLLLATNNTNTTCLFIPCVWLEPAILMFPIWLKKKWKC